MTEDLFENCCPHCNFCGDGHVFPCSECEEES